jgi:hypothetical protein
LPCQYTDAFVAVYWDLRAHASPVLFLAVAVKIPHPSAAAVLILHFVEPRGSGPSQVSNQSPSEQTIHAKGPNHALHILPGARYEGWAWARPECWREDFAADRFGELAEADAGRDIEEDRKRVMRKSSTFQLRKALQHHHRHQRNQLII